MSLNLILIIILIGALGGGAFWFVKKSLAGGIDAEPSKENASLEQIENVVNEVVSNTIRQSLKELDLTEHQLKQRKNLQRELRRSQYEASHGDGAAKLFMKKQIVRIMTDKRNKYHINETNIDNTIPFDMPNALKPRDKFEILLYVYMNLKTREQVDKKTGKVKLVPFGPDGLDQMIKENHLDDKIVAKDDAGNIVYRGGKPMEFQYYDITPERIEKAYRDQMKDIELTYRDKLEILSQRIFADQFGFGPVDMLIDTSIDEVQGGVSGVPANTYDIKVADLHNVSYSYESVWIVNGGKKIRVSALSFGTQDELVRVVQNIYKYDAPSVLSKKNGKVVSTMKNGSRVIAFRPPFGLSYGFIVRKFDSAPSVAPDKLLTDKGARIPILVSKWLTKGMFNIAITGEQGTGKTTWLKSIVRFMREDLSIRTQELTRELNLNFTYPKRNILSFVETESISAQDGLDFQKKTSGDINIIGEVASAIAASWIIQTAKVASRMSLFTHHAKTADDLVVAIRNNVMEVGNYTNERAVDTLVAECINIDEHFENIAAHRFMERITYITPTYKQEYPVEDLANSDNIERDALLNEDEYRRRITDRKTFETKDLVVFDQDNNRYKFLCLPENIIDQIKNNVTKEEFDEFQRDFSEIKTIEKELKAQDKVTA